MGGKAVTVFLLVALAFTISICTGCGSEEAEIQPYGPPQVQFPEDEGAHPESGVEWWYLNSILTDSEGREYTVMAAYFNPDLKILSISDLEAEQFHHEYSGYSFLSSYLPIYEEGRLDLRYHDTDHWYRTDPDSLSYRLEAKGTEIGLNLDLVSEKPPLMVGGDGLIEWTYENSYYYSLTRLQVEGQIEFTGKTIDVQGTGWMDHQWMDSLSERGWDWFSVQLENNTELIFWQIVNPDESIESYDLTIMFPDSSIYHTQDITLEKLDSWVSPASGREYGILWRVREKPHDLNLEIRARFPEHEIQLFEDKPIPIDFGFWEGGTIVSGSMNSESVSGTGYAELVRPPTGMPEGASNPHE